MPSLTVATSLLGVLLIERLRCHDMVDKAADEVGPRHLSLLFLWTLGIEQRLYRPPKTDGDRNKLFISGSRTCLGYEWGHFRQINFWDHFLIIEGVGGLWSSAGWLSRFHYCMLCIFFFFWKLSKRKIKDAGFGF